MSTPSNEFADNLFDQVLSIWVNPEIERRKQAGLIGDKFVLWAAQVIMDPSGPEQVRLNDEAQGIFKLQNLPDDSTVSPATFHNITGDIKEFTLAKDDCPNAGHITLIRHMKGFFIAFDFLYNAAVIADHVRTAQEFLDEAKAALSSKRIKAFVANLHVATELTAKSLLLRHPDKNLMTSKKHSYVLSKYNEYSKQGNTEQRFAQLLNNLANLRNAARYPNNSFSVTQEQAEQMLEVAEEMFAVLMKSIPKRAQARLAE